MSRTDHEQAATDLALALRLLVRRIRAAAPSAAHKLSWTQMAVLKRLETDGPATYLLSSRSDHGYNVVLATDAMTDRDGDAHRHSVDKIFPRLGEVDATDNLLARLNSRV
jgi:nicotinamidase-related amidase